MIKPSNHYLQVKLGDDTYNLVKVFATKLGWSCSKVLQCIVDTYLPQEVDKFCERMERLKCVDVED